MPPKQKRRWKRNCCSKLDVLEQLRGKGVELARTYKCDHVCVRIFSSIAFAFMCIEFSRCVLTSLFLQADLFLWLFEPQRPLFHPNGSVAGEGASQQLNRQGAWRHLGFTRYVRLREWHVRGLRNVPAILVDTLVASELAVVGSLRFASGFVRLPTTCP